jgi:hypothetical protein
MRYREQYLSLGALVALAVLLFPFTAARPANQGPGTSGTWYASAPLSYGKTWINQGCFETIQCLQSETGVGPTNFAFNANLAQLKQAGTGQCLTTSFLRTNTWYLPETNCSASFKETQAFAFGPNGWLGVTASGTIVEICAIGANKMAEGLVSCGAHQSNQWDWEQS